MNDIEGEEDGDAQALLGHYDLLQAVDLFGVGEEEEGADLAVTNAVFVWDWINFYAGEGNFDVEGLPFSVVFDLLLGCHLLQEGVGAIGIAARDGELGLCCCGEKQTDDGGAEIDSQLSHENLAPIIINL